MPRNKIIRIAFLAAAIIGSAAGALAIYDRGRPLQMPTKEQLFHGVTYARYVRWSPRPLMIHVLTVDIRAGGIRLLVTPPDEKGSLYPLRARTTSQFLQESGAQIAVNGDGFRLGGRAV